MMPEMNLELAEKVIRWTGGSIASISLVILMFGILGGTRRSAGRMIGQSGDWIRSPIFYLVTLALFLSFSLVLWRSLPLAFSLSERAWLLALGILFYFPGMAFVMWGRLALGRMYFVSTGLGAQLFADHQLVTNGPYAIVRHPMYAGLICAAFGSLFLYQTWTTAVFAIFAPFVLLRARREEQVLAIEFGDRWRDYCRRVPAIIPHLRREGINGGVANP
jgi:protein-S-isoprenylcysteine O-methyltransferase Ste14